MQILIGNTYTKYYTCLPQPLFLRFDIIHGRPSVIGLYASQPNCTYITGREICDCIIPQPNGIFTYIAVWLCGAFISFWQPSHSPSLRKTQGLQGPITMLTALLFLTPLLLDSWPAITLFAGAGKIMHQTTIFDLNTYKTLKSRQESERVLHEFVKLFITVENPKFFFNKRMGYDRSHYNILLSFKSSTNS